MRVRRHGRGRPRGNARLLIDPYHLARLAAAQYLPEVERRASDLRSVWPLVLEYLYGMEERLFEREGRTSEHSRWQDLSDNPVRFHFWRGYRTWKTMVYPGRGLLTLTGKLRGQLTGKRQNYVAMTPHSLTMGTDYTDYDGVPYRPRSPRDRTAGNDIGGIHAEGRMGRYRMPARTPIKVTRRNSFDIADLLMDHVLEDIIPRPRAAP